MTQHNFNCPYCNKQLAVGPSGISEHSPNTPWQQLGEFQNLSQGPLPGQAGPGLAGEWQRVTPVGRLVPKDIMTILLDSTIVFGLVSSATGLMFHYAGQTWLMGPFTGLVVAGIRYFALMANTQNLLTIVESWRSAEPKKSDQPQQPERVVKVEIKEGKRFKYAYLGIDERKLVAFAAALLDGAKFTEDQARKHNITQEELKGLREELINRGLAYWNNPTHPRMGVTLRHSCYTVFQGIIDSKQQQAA